MKLTAKQFVAIAVSYCCVAFWGAASTQAAVLAYEGFTEGTGNPALAGYSGTSEVGLTGTWSQSGGAAMTIRDGSGGQWGTPQSYWPAAEHTAWNLTRFTRSLASSIDLTVDGTYYMSFYVGTDQADHGVQVGLANATNELMAGNGYSGAANKGITAYYGALNTGIQTNANGTAIEGGWTGGMRQYQVVVELARSAGNLDVTVDYYRDAYDGVAETTRTVSLGAVSALFDRLQFKADGWNDIDEIRLGETLNDALGIVPEPSSLVLLCLALAGVWMAGRRRV